MAVTLTISLMESWITLGRADAAEGEGEVLMKPEFSGKPTRPVLQKKGGYEAISGFEA